MNNCSRVDQLLEIQGKDPCTFYKRNNLIKATRLLRGSRAYPHPPPPPNKFCFNGELVSLEYILMEV